MSITPQINQSINESVYKSINQSIKNQSTNPLNMQSINRSINQSMQTSLLRGGAEASKAEVARLTQQLEEKTKGMESAEASVTNLREANSRLKGENDWVID